MLKSPTFEQVNSFTRHATDSITGAGRLVAARRNGPGKGSSSPRTDGRYKARAVVSETTQRGHGGPLCHVYMLNIHGQQPRTGSNPIPVSNSDSRERLGEDPGSGRR